MITAQGIHPQLQAIADEFNFATARLHALAHAVPEDRWPVRRDPARWSVGECVAHLNLTGQAYAEILHDTIAAQPRPVVSGPWPWRYRRDLWGWLLWKSMRPPVRIRVKTIAPFVPESVAPVAQLMAEFEKWQKVQMDLLIAADGLPLNSIRVTSPFNAKVKYNLYSCFSILPAHQHRHLWQAERIWR